MKPSTLRLTTLVLSLAASGFASAETYIVDRYQDDTAKGSLRWAIEQSNANAVQENEIQIFYGHARCRPSLRRFFLGL